ASRNCKLVVRPRGGEPITAPRELGEPARSGTGIVWSRDGRRLLINDSRPRKRPDVCDTAFWVYEIANNKVSDLELPNVTYLPNWSLDGKRVLASVAVPEKRAGLAWVNIDGTGEPGFLTPDGEGALGAQSPDGKRVLYQGRTRSWLGQWGKPRLYVLDLT